MVKIAYANIILNSHRDNIVPCGSVVQGSLEFAYSEAEKIRGIRVEIIGITKTYWVETETYSTGKSSVTVVVPYGIDQYHVKTSILLWGSPPSASKDDVRDAPTKHTVLPFTFELPQNLPESYEGEIGFTRYYIKAIFDRPWRFDDEGRTIFTVVRDVNLNNMALLLTDPSSLTCENKFDKSVRLTCCCTPLLCGGRFQYDLSVPKLGYVPGEYINVFGKIHNRTCRDLKKLSIRLKQTVLFRGRRYGCTLEVGEEMSTRFTKVNPYASKVVKIPIESGEKMPRGKEVCLGSSSTDSSIRLLVPPIPTSRVDDGTPISIHYTLELATKSEGCIRLRKDFTPILIGNMPLVNLAMFLPSPQPCLAPPLVFFEPPPPSYQEVMAKTNKEQVPPAANPASSDQPTTSENQAEDLNGMSIQFHPKYLYYGNYNAATT